MKKNHDLRVKLSKEEYENLLKKVEVTGMNLSDFVRYVLKHSKIETKIVD